MARTKATARVVHVETSAVERRRIPQKKPVQLQPISPPNGLCHIVPCDCLSEMPPRKKAASSKPPPSPKESGNDEDSKKESKAKPARGKKGKKDKKDKKEKGDKQGRRARARARESANVRKNLRKNQRGTGRLAHHPPYALRWGRFRFIARSPRHLLLRPARMLICPISRRRPRCLRRLPSLLPRLCWLTPRPRLLLLRLQVKRLSREVYSSLGSPKQPSEPSRAAPPTPSVSGKCPLFM